LISRLHASAISCSCFWVFLTKTAKGQFVLKPGSGSV
jgi:hypothetical protein